MGTIGVFGGSFDPPHQGHVAIARYMLAAQLCSEVWFLPVNQHAFHKPLSASHHRVALLTAICEPRMRVEDWELRQSGTNFTYDTMRALAARELSRWSTPGQDGEPGKELGQEPAPELAFIMGSDNLAHFGQWHQATQLAHDFRLLIYPRVGSPFEPLVGRMEPLRQAPLVSVTSTAIRELVRQGQSISGLVPPAVDQYISSVGLYLAPPKQVELS